MGLFSKSIKYSKSSQDLDNKIKNLDEDLKKTGVTVDISDKISLCEDISLVGEEEKVNWRKEFYETPKTKDEILDDEISTIRETVEKKNKFIRRVDSHINSVNEDFVKLRKEIFDEISENFLFSLPNIEKKLNVVLEIYDQVKEGLLREPPEIKNKDPLTPLNHNFVTIEDLNKHYTLFINRVQEQLSTIGGGGETKLKYLDDIVGIATNPSAYDSKFLSYNHSLGKFEFVGVAFTAGGAGIGISIGENPPVDTALYPLWFNSIVGRSFIYYTDQDGSQWVDFSPSTQIPTGDSYWAPSTSGIHTLSNVGIGTTNPTTILDVQGGDMRVGVNTNEGVILTSPNGLKYRLIVDDAGLLSTVFIP